MPCRRRRGSLSQAIRGPVENGDGLPGDGDGMARRADGVNGDGWTDMAAGFPGAPARWYDLATPDRQGI